MKATTSLLFGQETETWRITCSADEPRPYRKLLKALIRLLDADDDAEGSTAVSVDLSGVTWESDEDLYVLTVFLGVV